jgi:hypothetical protein
MPTLQNRTKQLLIVPRNSGPAVYLAPGEAAELPAFEIDGNAKVEKLQKSGALEVKTEEDKPTREDAKAKKPKSDKQ